MTKRLAQLRSPLELHEMTVRELEGLADEIREALCNLLTIRTAHFASNLGVVELCLALHSVFDFRRDRLIWDTGHQIYPHKLVTGRYDQFHTIRTKGGLMGYPNPHESEYDLFMTGHAGASISTVLGLRSGDDLLGESDRHAVAVIGDGAFPSGMVFEAMNNAGRKKRLLMILNDNKMSICPRVGSVAGYLDRLRSNPLYAGLKNEVLKVLNHVPMFGDPVERFLAQMKEAVKAGLHGGMLFEELGFRYVGPIDGHDIGLLRKYLKMVKDAQQPVLLHVVTEKGHGFQPAAEDPVFFHTPPTLKQLEAAPATAPSKPSPPVYTTWARDAILDAMQRDRRVTVMTAAMCQGNKLEPIRDAIPDRFFDTGICESHTVAFAAGQAKAGLRPIVDIYSTFLQRSYDQIFQEVTLQNLPVVMMMDRAGLTGPDGPTHHGVFDIAYLRVFPNLVLMAPGEGREVPMMLDFALKQDGPTAIRYPKAAAWESDSVLPDIELGKAHVLSRGRDGMLLCYGALLGECVEAADQLRAEGFDVGVVNMRFAKPLDRVLIDELADECPLLITIEEGCLIGGFGSAVLEVLAERDGPRPLVRRLGIPDQFVEHGSRSELLADLKLDASGIASTFRLAREQCQV